MAEGRDWERSKERHCLIEIRGGGEKVGCGREERAESRAGAAGNLEIRSKAEAGSGRLEQTQMLEICPGKMFSY